MIKSHWSANTRRENLLPEILIRGDKKTKISQFVLFVREHVLKVSLWEESLGPDQGGEIWQIPAKTAIGQLISYHPPNESPFSQFPCTFDLVPLMRTQTVENLQIFPNPAKPCRVLWRRTDWSVTGSDVKASLGRSKLSNRPPPSLQMEALLFILLFPTKKG